MPVGQLRSHDAGGADRLEPDWADNDENFFSVRFDPHSSHEWEDLVPGFSRNSVTCPQSRHIYSNNGIRQLRLPLPAHSSQIPVRPARENGRPPGPRTFPVSGLVLLVSRPVILSGPRQSGVSAAPEPGGAGAAIGQDIPWPTIPTKTIKRPP